MFVFLCASLLSFAFILWHLTKVHTSKEPPIYPRRLPIIGHVHRLVSNSRSIWNFLKEVEQNIQCPQAFTFIIGPTKSAYIISDPDDFMKIANTCLQKNEAYSLSEAWLGDGLIVAPVPIWKRHRKFLNKVFSHEMLNGFLGVFNQEARKLVNTFSDKVGKGPFQHESYLMENTLKTICQTSLGVNVNNSVDLNKHYLEATKQMMNIITERYLKFWLHYQFIFNFSQLKKQQDKAVTYLHRMADTILCKRRVELRKSISNDNLYEGSDIQFKPFLDYLLELQMADESIFSDKEIREEVDNMVVGGQDTTGTELTYLLMYLGSYSDVQEKCYKELCQVFQNSDRDVTRDDLSQLVYLEATIKETLRLNPITPIISRKLDQDIRIKNFTLKAGKTCSLFIYAVNRDRRIWGPDAEDYRPERWLDPANADGLKYFMGFSFGKRGCIGKHYAMMSLKTTLVHLLRHYRIVADHSKLKFKLEILLKPLSGANIELELRN